MSTSRVLFRRFGPKRLKRLCSSREDRKIYLFDETSQRINEDEGADGFDKWKARQFRCADFHVTFGSLFAKKNCTSRIGGSRGNQPAHVVLS
mmetsp:Transcript_16282/g.46774  ORF Transcript_16282/g.46774 Transcript_16282/m.46774 type:complete len:92 (+) Transcript_16282:110-385(+)